jgi:1,2-phenylacetyl-CoA epoxidase catalytic subunit
MIEFTYQPKSIDYSNYQDTPAEYKKSLIRMLSIQAYMEQKATTEGIEWIKKAPSYRKRHTFSKIVHDEAKHSYHIYKILDNLGVSEQEAISIVEGGHRDYPKLSKEAMQGPLEVADKDNEWIDIMLNLTFLDRAGKYMVTNYQEASFKPWANANNIIIKDETGHVRFGEIEIKAWLKTEPDIKKQQQKVARWYVLGLNFFGPSSKNTAKKMSGFGLKQKSNDELRVNYIKEVEEFFTNINRMDLISLQKETFPYAA